jgi:hypothetical protein
VVLSDHNCDWNNPGSNPFRGESVYSAVQSYGFPKTETDEIAWKIKAGMPDAVIYIKQKTIISPFGEATNLRDMFFGNNRKCVGKVIRDNWSLQDERPALVYCPTAKTYGNTQVCVAIPVVCGNVSLIDYKPLQKMPKNFVEQSKVNTVPLPSTLMLVALALMFVKRNRKENREN